MAISEQTNNKFILLISKFSNHSFMGKDPFVRCIAYLQTQQSKTKWIATTLNNILPCLNWYFSDQHYLIIQAVDEEPKSHTVGSCSNTVDRVDKIIAKLECKKWKEANQQEDRMFIRIGKTGFTHDSQFVCQSQILFLLTLHSQIYLVCIVLVCLTAYQIFHLPSQRYQQWI